MRFDIGRASIEINGGSCCLIHCDLDFVKNELINSEKNCYFNFLIEGSKLIVPYFESLSTPTVARIVKKIRKVSGVKLRTEDITGMLIVSMLAELELQDTIVVELAGLGYFAMHFCMDLMKKFVSTDQSKRIIFVSLWKGENENLQITML